MDIGPIASNILSPPVLFFFLGMSAVFLKSDAVVANVQYQVTKLKRSKLLTGLVEEGKLKIVGGCYDLDTGEVTIVT